MVAIALIFCMTRLVNKVGVITFKSTSPLVVGLTKTSLLYCKAIPVFFNVFWGV